MKFFTSSTLRSNWQELLNSALFREFVLFSFSTLMVQGARFAVSIIAAKKLGPSTWGVWQLLYLFLAYSSIYHLGVTNGMNREIPILRGKGDERQVLRIRSVTLGVVLLVALFAGMALFASTYVIDTFPWDNALRGMALLLIAYMIYNYLEVQLRSFNLFKTMSRQQIFFACAFVLMVIPMVLKYSLEGFIIAQAFVITATALFVLKVNPAKIRMRFNLKDSLRLIKIGFPIMAGMVTMTFMMTADRLVVATFLDMEQLGYYALSIMVMRGLLIIPMVISKQLYPKMAETWGKTSNVVDLNNWIRIHVMMCLSLIIPLVALLWFLFPLFVNHFMGAYAPGITAMKITLMVPLFFGLAAVSANLLNIFDKQTRLMALRIGALLFNVIINIVLVKLGYGINGIAAGTLAAYILYYLAVATAGKSVIRKMEYQRYFAAAKTARI